MFNAIKGTLVSRTLDTVCVDTHGIEWNLAMPTSMVDLVGKVGDTVRVLVYLQHREDGMKLFGFPDARARARFLDLIKVEGIGPKQAVRILSGIAPSALDEAIEAEDLAALERVSGIGKKTAQKIVLALKGKIVSAKPEGLGEGHADVAQALVDMGYDRKAAEKAVAAAAKKHGGDEREVFRAALLALTGGA